MMHPRHVFVDLPKDRRPEVYRFRPPRGEAKGGGVAFHLLGKSKLCSRKNADRRCGVLRRSKPFIFRPLMSIDIPGLGTATNLEAVGTTQNMKGEKMLDKMSAR